MFSPVRPDGDAAFQQRVVGFVISGNYILCFCFVHGAIFDSAHFFALASRHVVRPAFSDEAFRRQWRERADGWETFRPEGL